MLLDAIQEIAVEFVGYLSETISTAASQGLFTFESEPDDEAGRQDLVNRILAFLKERTGGQATFVAAVEKEDAFALVMERLEAQIHRQQWRCPTVSVPELPSVASNACFLNGWRPGIEPYRVDPEVTDAKISHSAHVRRKEGRRIKHRLFAELLKDRQYESELCAKDLGDLAKNANQGRLDGKIAFIYVDGNNFGAIRRAECGSPADRRAFDATIQGVRRKFLGALLDRAHADEHFKTKDRHGKEALRIEVLLWGGDEMALVVPAWKGWEVLHLFYEHARGAAFGRSLLTHRGAVVFCPHNTPILRVRKLAGDLLDRAKSDITRHQPGDALGPAGNAFRYLNLTSFDLLQGSMDWFLGAYYKNIAYDRLLIQSDALPALWQKLGVLRRHMARDKVQAVVEVIRRETSTTEEVKAVLDRAESLVPHTQKNAFRSAMPADDDRAFWYLLSDLWDYILKWNG